MARLVFAILKHFLGKMNEKEYIATILVHFISSFSVTTIQSLLRSYSNMHIIYQQRRRINGAMHHNKREEGRKKIQVGIFIKQVKIFQFGL